MKDSLTLRQRQVLIAVALGKSSAEIGEELGIARRTVEAVRRVLLKKLERRTVAGLVAAAIQLRYVQPEDVP